MDNTQYGTLTIRSEIAVPMHRKDDVKVTTYRRTTLATYPVIAQADCPEIINRFCDENNISRLNLFCEWKFVVHF